MSDAPSITRSKLDSDVAVLTFDMPDRGANVLSSHVLDELQAHLDEMEAAGPPAGIILCSAKPGIFVAGADLREFAAAIDADKSVTEATCRRGQTLFQRLATIPCPTVAAIDGLCLGGGAELALWCDRRIMTSHAKTQYGFPEVKLGLYPGWGGTARTPRIIGLANAVEMVTGGESIDSAAALALGLVTAVVDRDRLLDQALELVRLEQQSQQYLADRQRWRQPLEINDTELGFLGVTASAYIRQQTKGNYPAPEAALELMLASALVDVDTALQNEARGMAQLFGSPVNKALLNVFFLSDRVKRDRGVAPDIQAAEIKSIGVIGAGIMGAGIAAANLKRELPVTMADADIPSLRNGVRKTLEEVSYNKATGQADPERTVKFAALLNESTDQQELSACDLVIEAIVEKKDTKQQLLKQLEDRVRDTALLASNTSTIPITELAAALQRPERFCGIHFFNPVRKMQLVEIIRGAETSDQTVATAVAYAKRIGKLPIVVKDGPGFLVNRLLFPYMNEALALISDGASLADIEKASRRFGMPMGPITLYDVVGLDTALYAGRTMWEAFPDRITPSPILSTLIKAGRLGQKSGQGFFDYSDKKQKGRPDPALEAILEPFVRGSRAIDQQEITNRLFLPMLLEATRVLEEGLVRDVRDVDLGLVYGLGFPAFRGGLLFWADGLGAAEIVRQLQSIQLGGVPSEPTPLLLEMARQNKTFYGDLNP